MARAGLTRGFGAGANSRSGMRVLRSEAGDEAALARASVIRAFDSLLRAGLSRLQLHYAARIVGLIITSPRERQAAIAALVNEREAALARLREEIAQSRARHLAGLRRRRRRRRYRIYPGPVRGGSPVLARIRHHNP